MFRVEPTETGKLYRLAIAGLLVLSCAALAVTVWVMADLLREQQIVRGLIRQLPPKAAVSAEKLAGELRWQFRLTMLVVLNLIVTGFALALLWRAYRMSQQSLRDITALAGDVLSSMDLAVITTDTEGHLTSINRCGLELLDLTYDCVGSPLHVLSGSLPLEEFRRASRQGGATRLSRDFLLETPNATRTLRGFCQPLRDHDDVEIGNVVQLRDITERALVDDRLRRMERYMGLVSLMAGLHHEIKNPLAALSLHVQLLEEKLEEDGSSAEVNSMLEIIKTEVKRVGGVLESFQDFASVGQLNRSDVDLASLIERQVTLIRPQADRQRVAVRVELPARPLPPVFADCLRLEQVLLNLMLNAMEAMPEGGTLAVRVTEGRWADERSVVVEVTDTGPGVPENLRDKIFDPYFTTKAAGTGMGLAICEKIVRQHHGHLALGPPASGTTFEVTLPVDSSPRGPTS